jgi:hypothetical protein
MKPNMLALPKLVLHEPNAITGESKPIQKDARGLFVLGGAAVMISTGVFANIQSSISRPMLRALLPRHSGAKTM